MLLLLPDFLLIVLGFAVCRWTPLDRRIWDAAERLVYYLLFPVLLFGSIVRHPLQPSSAALLAGCGLAVVGLGIVLAYALGRLPGIDRRRHASGAQCAFRFNSYVALALAERVAGPPAIAWTALLIALCVPVCNIAAVWPLARHGGQALGRELLRNPLIVATVSGLVASLLGLQLPGPIDTVVQRIGSAALPLGLMAVGAGLQVAGLRSTPVLVGGLLGIRHVALPLIALALVAGLGLPAAQAAVIVAFAALPTASSCCVLAARMGGDGPLTAGLVSLSTLLGMVSVPLWLGVLQRVG